MSSSDAIFHYHKHQCCHHHVVKDIPQISGNLRTISCCAVICHWSYDPRVEPLFHFAFQSWHSTVYTYRSCWVTDELLLFQMLESALVCMLEGRHISETKSDSFGTDYHEVCAKFWGQLQMLLKKMLAMALSANTNKSSAVAQPTPASNRHGDSGKLRELYKMSLKSTDLSQLHAMHALWTSV